MSQKIAVYSENRFKYFEAEGKALRKIALGVYRTREDGEGVDQVPLDHSVRPQGYTDGPLGVGNAMPFSRAQHPMRKPDALHYPVPAVGDHRMRWLFSFMVPETTKAEAY